MRGAHQHGSRRPPRRHVVTLALAASLIPLQAAGVPDPTPGVNLASGKTCQFDPAPNYDYCTDAGDPLQLTDGLYNGCSWTDEGTVGWGHVPEPVIELDLGSAAPVGTVTFDTIAGAAGVTFPLAVLVFVSEDGNQYRYLCDVLTETLPQTQVVNHRFAATGLKGWGRYVRVVVLSGGFYAFCDELEIMQGSHAQHEAEYPDETPIAAADVKAYAIALRPWATQKSQTLTLLRETEQAVTARALALGDPAFETQALDRVEQIRGDVLADFDVDAVDYRQGPPYRDHDLEAFRLVAGANARLWPGRDFVVWEKGSWDELPPLDAPAGAEPGAHVRVDMMSNEWAVASFVVTSASTQSLALVLTATDFQGPASIGAGSVLRIAHVVHVEASGFRYPDDAIVPPAEGPVLLHPGVSKRIWLTFTTHGAGFTPGLYESMLTVATAGTQKTVPLALRVWPLQFPDRVTSESVSWGYFDDPNLVGNETSAAQDLAEHYNTALVLNHRYLPKPNPDANGDLIDPLDFTKVDQMLAWNPQCRLWLLWVGFEFGFGRMGTGQFGTPVWENAFTQYVTQMRDHLATRGIGRDRFAWYWRDEPTGSQWTDEHMTASTTLKSIDPDMLVWSNPNVKEVTIPQLEAALPYTDVLCPALGGIWGGVLEVCWKTRRPSWMYASGSSKTAPPFEYYRWFSWRAWKSRLGGVGMWVYVDENARTFSDYADGPSFAMIYKGDQGVIGSKRWDAWRQGIADYEYLRMLRDAVEAAGPGFDPDTLAKAQAVLGDGVNAVVGSSPHSGDSGSRDLPDSLRLDVLRCLDAFRAADYYVYVATDGGGGTDTPDKIHCFEASGGLVWTFNDPFPESPLRWFAMERDPVGGQLHVLSFEYANAYSWDRLTGRELFYPATGGARFTDGGTLNDPTDMAFGPDGHLYVTNEDATRGVQRFDGATGAFIDVFCTPGTVVFGCTYGPDGHLYVTTASGNVMRYNGATGAYMGDFVTGLGGGAGKPQFRDGDLYVTQGQRILRISGTGVNLGEFVVTGSGGLGYPADFKWTPDGDLLVCDYYPTPTIRRYDGTSGAYIDDFVAIPADEYCRGMVIDAVIRPLPRDDYKVYVAAGAGTVEDEEDRVYRFNSGGGVEWQVPDPWPQFDEMNYGSMVLGTNGLLYATAHTLAEIHRYAAADGAWSGVFAPVTLPGCMTFGPDGNLYVGTEALGDGVLRFAPDGTPLGVFCDPGLHCRGLAFGADGHLYVSVGASVQKYDGVSGASLGTFCTGGLGNSGHIAWHDGYLYAADLGALSATDGSIHHFTGTGAALGWFVTSGSGGLDGPRAFDWTPAGELLVCDYHPTPAIRRYDGRTGAHTDSFATFTDGHSPKGLVVAHIPLPREGALILAR